MEASVAGFKVRGSWSEVVEHGERVTRALRDVGAHRPDADHGYPDAFTEWDDWRPKSHERIEQEVSEKTADQASVEPGKGEQAGKEPDEDIKTAGEKLSESYEKLENESTEEAVDRWSESVEYVARAADSAGRKALRKVEDTVYQRVMTQLAPYYFDNELVSANLQRTTQNGETTFIFEVNVNDDDLKPDVAELLSEYEQAVDRWHIDTEKATERVEAVEGVTAPESDGNSKSTTN